MRFKQIHEFPHGHPLSLSSPAACAAIQVAEYEQCRLLLVDKKISTARDFINILEGALRAGYPIMIMAEDIEQEPLATLVVNKLRGALKVRGFWIFRVQLGCQGVSS